MNKSLNICDRSLYVCLLALIFFLPYSLMLVSTFEGVTAALWIIIGLLWGFRANLGRLAWPLAAIVLLILFTLPLSHCPFLSLRKLGTRFLYDAMLVCIVGQVVQDRKHLNGLLAMILFMAFFTAFNAVIQLMQAWNDPAHSTLIFGRVYGTMRHPNDLATMMVTVLPLALAMGLVYRRWVLWLVFAALVVVLGLTSSRGAWFAFAVSMAAFSLCLGRRSVVVLTVLLLLLFFWVFGMYCLSTRIELYNAPITHGPVMKPTWQNPWGLPDQYSAFKVFSNFSGRNSYWGIAVGLIKSHPIFGCGYDAYSQTLKDLKIAHTEYPHNSLLHITAELGFAGLALYLWLFAALCFQARDVLRGLAGQRDLFLIGCGTACGILAWLVHSLLDTPWSSLKLSILLWVMIGLLMSLDKIKGGQSAGACKC